MYQTSLRDAHLCVRNLKRSMAFYRKFLGLHVTEIAAKTAFMTSGGPHHELALWELGAKASTATDGTVGVNHLTFDVSDKRSFDLAHPKLTAGGIKAQPVDHRMGCGAYLNDSDGNGIEIDCDTREEPDGASRWRGEDRPLPLDRIRKPLRQKPQSVAPPQLTTQPDTSSSGMCPEADIERYRPWSFDQLHPDCCALLSARSFTPKCTKPRREGNVCQMSPRPCHAFLGKSVTFLCAE